MAETQLSLTKKVECSSPSCGSRRLHHEKDTPRGQQILEVPINHMGPWYCSIECSMYKKSR